MPDAEQLELDVPRPRPAGWPQHVEDFLAGAVARFAYGEKPTAEQRRRARLAAMSTCAEISRLKADA